MASVTAAVLNYALNAIMIPRYGYIAAAYTTLIGYLFLLFAHMIIVKKLGFYNVYSYRFVLIVILVMLSLTLGINYLYRVYIIRYIILCIMFAISVIVIYNKRLYIRKLYKMVWGRT